MLATVLRVRDVSESVRWWREKLGVEPLHVGADGDHPIAAFVVAGSIVSLWQLPAGEQRTKDDNDRNSYVVLVVGDDLVGLRDDLVGRGVDADEPRRSAGNEFFWFHDPDGNRFEVSRPVTAEFRAAAARAEGAPTGASS